MTKPDELALQSLISNEKRDWNVLTGQVFRSGNLESTMGSFGMFVVDSQFRISQLNATAQNGAFRNVRPVIGRDFGEAIRIIWPEPLATEVIATFRRTLETGEPYHSSDFENQRHDVEVTEAYEWELQQITLPDNEHAVICYYYDSTRVRQAEDCLRESEERLRLATEVAGLGIWHWYPDSDRAIWENEKMFEIYGRSREEGVLSATEFAEKVVHPDERRGISPEFEQRLRDGQCRNARTGSGSGGLIGH